MKSSDLFSSVCQFAQSHVSEYSFSDRLTKAIENAEEHVFDKSANLFLALPKKETILRNLNLSLLNINSLMTNLILIPSLLGVSMR